LRDAGSEYLQARLQLTKLQAFEKIARVTGIIFSMMIISLVGCFTIVFVGLMGGFLLSDLTHSNAIGFSIVGVLFVLLFVILIINREKLLEKPIAEKVVRELFEDESPESGNEDPIDNPKI
jgi:hypothetical protein